MMPVARHPHRPIGGHTDPEKDPPAFPHLSTHGRHFLLLPSANATLTTKQSPFIIVSRIDGDEASLPENFMGRSGVQHVSIGKS
ncbi:MAG: hypothetical protein Q9159_006181 [Coniocarpon cinnabarinum]